MHIFYRKKGNDRKISFAFLQIFYASAAKDGKYKYFLCRFLHGPVEQISMVSTDGYDKLEMPLTLRVWKVSSCAHQLPSAQQEAEGEPVPVS